MPVRFVDFICGVLAARISSLPTWANFDQLNRFLPYIMLIFIPAITMSVWSEERRQGTDELLLTLPAHDFDIVIGKYFAAVLVFTVSLLFSQLSNYAVLISMTGGDLDSGLLFFNVPRLLVRWYRDVGSRNGRLVPYQQLDRGFYFRSRL